MVKADVQQLTLASYNHRAEKGEVIYLDSQC